MIVRNQSKDGQWFFVVKTSNGKTLVTIEAYKSKRNCKQGVEALQYVMSGNNPNFYVAENSNAIHVTETFKADKRMTKHTIDYEFGKAEFYTYQSDANKALEEFYSAANTCFGIRKSIGDTEVLKTEPSELPETFSKFKGVTHALLHHGDSILFDNTKGDWRKIKSEWD